MGIDLESNQSHGAEVSCLDLSRSRDRCSLEVVKCLDVATVNFFFFSFFFFFSLSLYIKKTQHHHLGGIFAVQKLAARLKLENN